MATSSQKSRQRVPASERRDALIEAAKHEFAVTGFHGTPVDRIARAVGVAQPYVFSLFGSKRDLFLAAVERCFERAATCLTETAEGLDASEAPTPHDVLMKMGASYMDALSTDRDLPMLQLQAYAACGDPVIRDRVRHLYAGLVRLIERVSGADSQDIDDFLRYGTWINVGAAMGIEDFSVDADWIREAADDDAADDEEA